MKVLLVLLVVTMASAQFNNPFAPRGNRRPQVQRRPTQFRRPQQQQFFRSNQQQQLIQGGSSAPVHGTRGNVQYHYSWRVQPGRKFSGGGAKSYCRGLGREWTAVSINDRGTDSFITNVIGQERQEYIWTGGEGRENSWRWPVGQFGYTNWSARGGGQRPQPDNREGNEHCLAILNNFYRDGITWHDVACSHTKPVICQKQS